jgi:NACalpha-BTF3-like transcription factor
MEVNYDGDEETKMIRIYRNNKLVREVEIDNKEIRGDREVFIVGEEMEYIADEVKVSNDGKRIELRGKPVVKTKNGKAIFMLDTIPYNTKPNNQKLNKEAKEELEHFEKLHHEQLEIYEKAKENYRKKLDLQKKVYKAAREKYKEAMKKYNGDFEESSKLFGSLNESELSNIKDGNGKIIIKGNSLFLDMDSLRENFSKLNLELDNFDDKVLHFNGSNRLNKESIEQLLGSLESLKSLESLESLKGLHSLEGLEGLKELKKLEGLRDLKDLSSLKASISAHVASLQDIKQSLIADGIIEKGDKMRLKFNDKGMKVNGKKLNPTQLGKYLPMLKSLTKHKNNRFEYHYKE